MCVSVCVCVCVVTNLREHLTPMECYLQNKFTDQNLSDEDPSMPKSVESDEQRIENRI